MVKERIKWKRIEADDDRFELDEFVGHCQPGHMFTDDDGAGYYALTQAVSNVPCVPSDVARGKVDRRFTHVVWYNK